MSLLTQPTDYIFGRPYSAKTNYHIHECFLSYLTDIMLVGCLECDLTYTNTVERSSPSKPAIFQRQMPYVARQLHGDMRCIVKL